MLSRLIAAALVTASCGAAGDSPVAPPAGRSAPAPRVATPAPSRISGVVATVNGRGYELGAYAYIDDDAPIVVRLRFPVAMDRASVESAIRGEWSRTGTTVDARLDWSDDVTLALTTTRTLPFAVSVTGASSSDRASVLDAFAVAVAVVGPSELSFYKRAELVVGKVSPRSSRARVQAPFAVSGDGKRLLAYTPIRSAGGPLPYVLDLTTGARTALRLPEDETRFAFAGWLADGRMLLVGQKLWLAGTEGESPRVIADVSRGAAPAGAATPSPNARSVAVWQGGRLSIVDLASGARRDLALAVRGCADMEPVLAWSMGGSLLAATDCPDGQFDLGVTRVLEAATGQEVRTAPLGTSLAWLPNAELLVLRPAVASKTSGKQTAPTAVLLDAEGTPTRAYDALAMLVSPDGRFVYLRYETQGVLVADLVELSTDRAYRLALTGAAVGWTRQNELVVLR